MTYQQYLSSPWASSLDSLEGVPDLDVFLPRTRPEERNAAQRVAHETLAWIGEMLPGIGLAFLLAYLGDLASEAIGARMRYQPGKSPISPITLAVIFGLLIRNTVGVP